MSWQIIITGFLLGAVSSFHCVGMCGPIALSLPVHYLPARQKTVGIILYNLGRISLYALLGVFFGFAGRQFYLGGLQQGFSIFLGSLLIALFLMTIWKVNKQPLGFVDKGTPYCFLPATKKIISHVCFRGGQWIAALWHGVLCPHRRPRGRNRTRRGNFHDSFWFGNFPCHVCHILVWQSFSALCQKFHEKSICFWYPNNGYLIDIQGIEFKYTLPQPLSYISWLSGSVLP